MARSKKYDVTVNFTVSWHVAVKAEDKGEAMEKAEYKAIEEFYEQFGSLLPSDFVAEAQEP